MPTISSVEGRRIQPTYEELKPPSPAAILFHFYCIQPTYEELKRVISATSIPSARSIQPTYEELKQYTE